MKRIIALVLCLLMCLPLFVACGGDDPADTTKSASDVTTKPSDTTNNSSVTTGPQDTNDTGDVPPIPGIVTSTRDPDAIGKVAVNDWDGYQFKIYYSTSDNCQTDFICDNPNGNVLNDQVYARNTKVETLLNVDLHTDPHTTAYATVIQSQFSAGWTEGDYNMYGGTNRGAINLSIKGHVADLATYDEINMYRPHWDQGYVDALTINDSLYSLVGAYSVKANLFVSSLCFNKNLFQENGLDEPYNLVKTYEWTVDALLDYMEGFAQDLDNDGYDWDKDIFALSGWGTESSYGIFYGSGFTYCKNDGDTIAIDYDRDLLDDILDVNIDIWSANGVYLNESAKADQHHMPFEIFTTGRGLFCDIVLYKISMFFTEMEDDYGILPEPMFTADQKQYFTYTGYTIPILLVPSVDPNAERTGNIVEAICAASNDIVIPKMFEIVTKIQHARDEDSAAMIDIIISNKIFDSAHWLALSGYNSLVRSIIKEKQNISASYIKMYGGKAEDELEDFLDAYAKLKK